jgi:hypothetical protein
MTKRNIGITLLFVSILMWAIGRFTQLNSEFIGKLYCGDRYMKPVDGIVGDVSCGFNADMYLVAFLFAVFLIGVLLLIFAKRGS